MQPIALEPILARMDQEIRDLAMNDPLMIGIHTGGAWIAERLHRSLAIDSPLCSLDISFYRDDFSRVGLNPRVRSSSLPADVEGREVILVDDVLYTGRTIRAALNEIFSWGRPSLVRLAVALDRPARELPVQADVVGRKIELDTDKQAKITRDGNDVLNFEIVTRVP